MEICFNKLAERGIDYVLNNSGVYVSKSFSNCFFISIPSTDNSLINTILLVNLTSKSIQASIPDKLRSFSFYFTEEKVDLTFKN